MNFTAHCLCGETLTWQQLVNGSWVDISNNFSQVDAQTWDFTPTQQQINAGSIEIRYCCDTICSNVSTINFNPLGNVAVGLDSPISRTSGEDQGLDLSGFTCSDGTPIDEWRASWDGGATWFTVNPAALDPKVFDCAWLQFRCDLDWSDAELEYDIVANNTYVDTVVQIDQGVQGFFSICYPCGTGNQIWQVRIDDAEADEDHALTPNIVTGDRPNSDPGAPEPVDQAWQDIDPVGSCRDCAVFDVDEIWGDGVDPDNQLGEFFVFYLRTSCDGGATWEPEIKVTLET